MSKVYILLGGNLSDRKKILNFSIKKISEEVGKILSTSSVYETEPWGFNSSDLFLNQVIIVQTELSPNATLKKLQDIEKMMGRVNKAKQYESRLVDLDILFFDNLILDTKDLKIPHPHLHKRRFTLIPLVEVAGSFIHPTLNICIDVLINQCDDNSKVTLFEEKCFQY